MEWVPILNFRLSVKLGGGGRFSESRVFLEIKEHALHTFLEKEDFRSKSKKGYMDSSSVFIY